MSKKWLETRSIFCCRGGLCLDGGGKRSPVVEVVAGAEVDDEHELLWKETIAPLGPTGEGFAERASGE